MADVKPTDVGVIVDEHGPTTNGVDDTLGARIMAGLSAPFTTGPFRQRKGTPHVPRFRRTLSGKRKPVEERRPAPDFGGVRVGGGPSAREQPDHPSRKHDTDLTPSVVHLQAPAPIPPGTRRRERRRVSVYIDAQARKARRAAARQ